MPYKSPVMTTSVSLEKTLPVIRCVAAVEDHHTTNVGINELVNGQMDRWMDGFNG